VGGDTGCLVTLQQTAASVQGQGGGSQLSGPEATRKKGQRDNEKGQKKRRPLNDRACACLNAFNRRCDRGDEVAMAQHCREFCKEVGDTDSVYRTLKDYSDLWHKSARKGTKQGTR
jgi:hypothetical protein